MSQLHTELCVSPVGYYTWGLRWLRNAPFTLVQSASPFLLAPGMVIGEAGEQYRSPATLPTHLLNVVAAAVLVVGEGPRQVPRWLWNPPSMGRGTPRHPAPQGLVDSCCHQGE